MYNLGAMGNAGASNAIWTAVAAILAVVGGIVLYFTFLRKKNDGKFTGFLGWMYDFLTFKKMMIEEILRVCYLIMAIFVTLASFSIISNFLLFICTLVIGNIIVRMIYEFSLILLIICRNTTNINDKLNKREAAKVEEPKAE